MSDESGFKVQGLRFKALKNSTLNTQHLTLKRDELQVKYN